ncbi:hypothetical protein IPF86_01890 [Candidatus Nomurabacteria bacterium]|jgi:hypothetical protein|nr:MAG: hypothetical protein IPF86_01890 [Candidatus Nomurabacteria bacterium]
MKSPEQSFASQAESKENYIGRLAAKAATKMKMLIPALLMTVATTQSFANIDTSLDDKKPKKTTEQKAETRKKIMGVLLQVGDAATANASDQTRSTYHKAKQVAIAVEGGISTIENNKK